MAKETEIKEYVASLCNLEEAIDNTFTIGKKYGLLGDYGISKLLNFKSLVSRTIGSTIHEMIEERNKDERANKTNGTT